MIVSYPRSDHECIMVELQDQDSRVRIHFHRDMNGQDPKVRQVEVVADVGTILAIDLVQYTEDEMECDL